MNHFELLKLKNHRVQFKNEMTKRLYGDVWLTGHLTSVMSHIISVDGVPYSRDDLDIEEFRNG